MATDHVIGKMWAQLGLDKEGFDKSLKNIKTDAGRVVLDVEKNFKTLGIKSSQHFDLMRQRVENAYQGIVNSANKSANDIVRAEKAKNDQLQRLNEQQFGHQTSLINNLKSHWLAASAAIASALYTINKVWDMAKAGAEYEEARGMLNNLAQQYSMTADSIVSNMAKASDGLIANTDLMSVALAGLSKGLKPEQLIELAGAAEILGDAIGVSATKALEDLTQALETGRTKGLKNYLGTTIDLEAAFGELTSKLTDAEKAQALYNLTIIAAKELQIKQTQSVDDSADSFERIEVKWKNLITTVERATKSIIVGILSLDNWKQGALAISGIEIDVPESSKKAATSLNEQNKAIQEAIAPYQAQIDLLKKEVSVRAESKKAIDNTTNARKKEAKELKEDYISQAEWQSYYWETVTDMQNEAMDERSKAMEKAIESTEELTTSMDNQFKELQQVIEGWGKESADAIVEFCTGGKASFTDMINSMIKDLLRMMVYQNITKPLFGMISGSSSGGGGGFLGNLGGFFGMGNSGLGFTSSNLSPTTVFAGPGSYSNVPGWGGLSGLLSGLGSFFGFQEGGWIPEPVIGRGLKSNRMYSFAENEPEMVVPQKDLKQRGASQVINNYFNIQTPNPDSFRKSKSQIATDLSRTLSLARRYS